MYICRISCHGLVLSGVLIDILSPSTGIVNKLIMAFGGQPAFFLGDNRFFQGTMIVTDIWKEFGFNTIVYLAAITSIDPSLYESAVMDGAKPGFSRSSTLRFPECCLSSC